MDGDSVIILSIYVIITLVFSAFFSGMEIAFVSANRLKIALDDKQGGISARILSYFDKKPARFIGAMLLGNNAAIVAYSMLMAILLEPVIRDYLTANELLVLLIQTIITTLIVLLFAEFLPKAIFRINPNRALRVMVYPLITIYVLLWVPTMITIGIAELLLKIFIRRDDGEDKVVFEKVDLDNYLDEHRAVQNPEEIEHEVKIFHNALNFSEVIARDCMVPRNEIIAFELEDSLEDLRQKFIETGLSKILIYRDSIDNIIGYVHSYELFKSPDSIKSVLLPVSIIPESITANKILEELIKKNRSIALVVDEFGGTSGMITMEDVIEEIFGEIDDEHDHGDISNRMINEFEFELSGRAEIDFINEKFRLHIPESEEYETLSGFIISNTESIPKPEEVIVIGDYIITVKESSNTRIEMVYLRINQEE